MPKRKYSSIAEKAKNRQHSLQLGILKDKIQYKNHYMKVKYIMKVKILEGQLPTLKSLHISHICISLWRV